MKLFHYYDKRYGPLKSLSNLSLDEANQVINKIKKESPNSFCAKRDEAYMENRFHLEEILKEAFIKKGGKVEISHPNYFVVEEVKWLEEWFINPAHIEIDIKDLDINYISFTYGDSYPTFSNKVLDNKEYRKRVYTYSEILQMIDKYGYPNIWNKDGKHGPERYIEAQVWTNKGIHV